MNLLRNNKLQKLSTIFLLCLLVFINAVKIFHKHDFSYSTKTEKSNKDTKIIKAAFSCSICDFQLAKDSDAAISSFNIEAPVDFISVHYNYILPVATSFAIASDNKGPPSIA